MKTPLALISMLALSAGLYAENANESNPHFAKIVDIEAKRQVTPNYQAKGPDSKEFEAREWYEIEAEIKLVTTDPSGVIPELKAHWYAVIADKVGKKTKGQEWPVLLSGESTYKNVRVKDGTVFLSAYVEPGTLKRYLGDGYLRKSDFKAFKAFAITLSGEGLNVDKTTKRLPAKSTDKAENSEKPWWDNWGNRDYNRESIVAKSQTPFSMMWIDRYPAEKVVQ